MLTKTRTLNALVIVAAAVLLLAACGDTDAGTATEATEAVVEQTETVETEPAEASDEAMAEGEVAVDGEVTADALAEEDAMADQEGAVPVVATTEVNLDYFFDGTVIDAATEPCVLSGGAETTCYRLTVGGSPVSYEIGPFCPSTINDDASAGGIWFDGNAVYDIDGEFIAGLAELYDDDNWMLFDEDGNVNVTETAEEFDGAARPNVDPSLQNHCVEGRLEWLPNGEPIQSTVLIPVEPVFADGVQLTRGNLGVTLDGVVIAQSAPVNAILGAYTIAAFDDCGGHFNPVEGYHVHGAVGCSEIESGQFAYAMDGFPIHSPLADPSSEELDQCGGQFTEEEGYHYHANSAEQNLVITCLMGQTATALSDAPLAEPADDAAADAGTAPVGEGGGGPDFSAAAEALGVTVEELEGALGGPPPDFDAAAATLGISVDELTELLPAPGR